MAGGKPTDDANLLERLIDGELFMEHKTTSPTGRASIAVDFSIVPARMWEAERRIRSSLVLGETGRISTIDIRFPEVSDGDIPESVIREAAEHGRARSALPDETNIVIAGWEGRHQPHYKFPHGDTMSTPFGDFGDADLRPRTAVRAVSKALEEYREYMDRRVG